MQSLLTGWIQILIIPFIEYVICTSSLISVNCGCLIDKIRITIVVSHRVDTNNK